MVSVEAYLDRVCDRLRGNPAEIEDIRREIRLHLEDLIEEYCAEGLSRPEAAERAIAWLGDAEQIRTSLDFVHHGDPAWVRRLKGMALGGLLGAILSPLFSFALPGPVAVMLLGGAAGCCIGLLSVSHAGLAAGLAVGSLTWFAARVGAVASFLASAPATASLSEATNSVLLALILGAVFGLAIAAFSTILLSLSSRTRRNPD